MNKTSTIGPFRISDPDKKIIDAAATKTDTKVATKGRDLLLAWAKKVMGLK